MIHYLSTDLLALKDSRGLVALAKHVVWHTLPPPHFKNNYLSWWLSGSQADASSLHALLDAYWENLLDNCYRTYPSDGAGEGEEEFRSHDLFLFLLDKYGVKRDANFVHHKLIPGDSCRVYARLFR